MSQQESTNSVFAAYIGAIARYVERTLLRSSFLTRLGISFGGAKR